MQFLYLCDSLRQFQTLPDFASLIVRSETPWALVEATCHTPQVDAAET